MLRAAVLTAAATVAVNWCIWAPPAVADNPVCTSTWCSFFSPSRNLGCEMNYHRGSGIPDETYCQSNSPPQSVRMDTSGSFKLCTGNSCLGNAGQGTPVLAYGQTAGVGPFSC